MEHPIAEIKNQCLLLLLRVCENLPLWTEKYFPEFDAMHPFV